MILIFTYKFFCCNIFMEFMVPILWDDRNIYIRFNPKNLVQKFFVLTKSWPITYYFWIMMGGSGSETGSVSLTSGSGFGIGRPKNFRIRNTGPVPYCSSCHSGNTVIAENMVTWSSHQRNLRTNMASWFWRSSLNRFVIFLDLVLLGKPCTLFPLPPIY